MRITIITINYNNVVGLRKTMESVCVQTYTDFEYVVIDGSSTDGSVEVLNEIGKQIQQNGITFKSISETDTGIYDAMNKGIRLSSGEYLLFLNSADYLVNENVLNNILNQLDGTDIIQGNIIEDFSNCSIRNRGYGKSNITFLDVIDAQFLHQSTFFNRQLFNRYGLYEDKFKKGSDTYFYTKCLALGNATFKYIDIDISNFDTNGISSLTDIKWIQIDKEEDAIWYGENFSERLINFYNDAPPKMLLYDTLKKIKIIWKITLLLVKIVNSISPPESRVKKEIIR